MKPSSLIPLLWLLLSLGVAPGRATATDDPPGVRPAIIISDVDDTIKLSHIVTGWGTLKETAWNILNLKNEAFQGIPELYRALTQSGSEIHFVSTTPTFAVGLLNRFLKVNHFPPGEVHSRDSLLESEIDYKIRVISELIRANPAYDFIFIGDNGQIDAEAFDRLQSDPRWQDRIREVLIHRAYPDSRHIPTQPQINYLTAADLTVELHRLNLIDDTQVGTLLSQTLEEIDQVKADRVIPYFAEVTPAEMQARFSQLASTDPVAAPLLTKIAQKIRIPTENEGACRYKIRKALSRLLW